MAKPAEVFFALGDESRLTVMRKLGERGPASISQLSRGMKISRQALTKHLRILEEAGLLRSEKLGRQQIFSLEQRRLEIARDYLDAASKRWDMALARLKEHLGE